MAEFREGQDPEQLKALLTEVLVVSGHIPMAVAEVNWWKEQLNGLFIPVESIRQNFKDQGYL